MLSERPSFDVALAASRMSFLSKLSNAPVALIGLSQVAGAEWRLALVGDLCDMRCALKPMLDQFPLPTVDPHARQDLAMLHLVQWKQLIKMYMHNPNFNNMRLTFSVVAWWMDLVMKR